MRVIMSGILAGVLGACAPAVRDMRIADLDLADGKTLAKLQQALPPDDRAALGTYALLHWPKSKFYCGKPIGGRAREAVTVGDAIAQSRAYEASVALAEASARTNAALAARSAETALVTQMEELVLERDMLFGRMGPSAASSARAVEIKAELAALRQELEQVRDRRPA
jgi:hypothetical protein